MANSGRRDDQRRMSTNAPPAVFVIGILLLPLVFLAAVLLIPAPVGVPVGICAAIVVGIATNRLTKAQVRREAEQAERTASED